MKSGWKWYGVKTVYRLEPSGSPEAIDSDYWAEGSLVEERVVLFRARTYAEACRKAEREATQYTSSTKERNPYGQKLALRYLGSCDAYELFPDEAPASGMEVFSTTELTPRSVPDATVIKRRLGSTESKRAKRRRKNFCLLLFNGPVPGVKPTRAELADARRLGLIRDTAKGD